MCGRYALALRPAQVRQMLEDDSMPVYEAPPDPGEDDEAAAGAGSSPVDDDDAPPPPPRQSYNFAPGYHGVVYRADVPDWGAGPRGRRHGDAGAGDDGAGGEEERGTAAGDDGGDGRRRRRKRKEEEVVRYKLQSMKWGLVPFWTKRKNPDYGSAVMKTINCRDDSLAQGGGMWSSMKARKRCVVLAQGFYEWLKKGGGGEKVPHFVKRRDGKLMCFAGLWDVVQYENDEDHVKHYTYTVITTDSNKQLGFLHDRMPVILENGSDALRTWLDPKRHEWSKELQSLLRPFDGELDVYPVSKDVGKVGNNSPSFIIPVGSKENKNNIANFFARGAAKKAGGAVKEEQKPPPSTMKKEPQEEDTPKRHQPEVEVKRQEGFSVESDPRATEKDNDQEEPGDASQSTRSISSSIAIGVKRDVEEEEYDDNNNNTNTDVADPPKKKAPRTTGNTAKTSPHPPSSSPPVKGGTGRSKISATSNGTKNRSPKKPREAGAQKKITNFFANSS